MTPWFHGVTLADITREDDMHKQIETLVDLFEQKRLSRRQLIAALMAAATTPAQRAAAAPSLFEDKRSTT